MLFNATLISALSTSSSKGDWNSKLATALPSPRTITMKHDTNSSATDPWASGSVFLQAQLTGPMQFNNGDVSNFGNLKNVTVNNAVNLSTGKSVMRIESGGKYVEATIGLAGSGADYILSANPTGTNGIAFASSARLKAPQFLPSGKGPTAPAIDANAPSYVIIENWTDPANVVEAGRIHFDTRGTNWVFDDAEVAAEIGDIRYTYSTESVVYGEFEFGAIHLAMNAAVNSEAAVPLHQVLISFRPIESNWPSYPRQTGATGGGMKRGTRNLDGSGNRTYIISNTFMPPFKAKICKADGTVLFTHDMPRDNLPINSPQLSEVVTKTKPIRPSMHCASMLEWTSHVPKMNSKKAKYFPGVDAKFLRPSLMKERAATNGIYPMYYIAQSGDSIGQWYGAPKWSQPCDATALTADEASRGTNDPYLWPIGPSGAAYNTWATPSYASFYNVPSEDYGSVTYGFVCVQGWAWEPGSYSLHDHCTGPGGIRIDRAALPTPMVMHLTDPTLKHMRDDTPIAEVMKHWNKAYFNHACHHVTDVKTFASVPVAEVLEGKWCYGNIYYNGSDTLTTLDKTIPLMAVSASQGAVSTLPHWGHPTNSDYKMLWNGWGPDWFHNYHNPHAAALFYNSPAHAISGKFRYLGNIMAQAGGKDPTQGHQDFMIRNQAWRWLHHAMMWKMASDHPLGIKREDIEARIETELESIYTNLYLPIKVNNSQTMTHRTLRNLGLTVQWYDSPGEWGPSSFSLHYYLAHVLQMWRQFGLWKKMRDRSDHCNKALLLVIEMLDLGAVDYYLDTDGCYSGGVYGSGINLWVGNRTTHDDTPEVAASWADWLARVNPKASSQENLITNPNGSARQPDIGEFSRMQWVFIRRDYFSDISSPRDINACCTKVQGWIDTWHTNIQAIGTQRGQALAEWKAHPALGRILPPTTVEP